MAESTPDNPEPATAGDASAGPNGKRKRKQRRGLAAQTLIEKLGREAISQHEQMQSILGSTDQQFAAGKSMIGPAVETANRMLDWALGPEVEIEEDGVAPASQQTLPAAGLEQPNESQDTELLQVASVIATTLDTTREHFIRWLGDALYRISQQTLTYVPRPDSSFLDPKILAGQLAARVDKRDVEVLSDGQEAARLRLLELSPLRLKVEIFASARPHGRLAYALLLQHLSWDFKEAGDLPAQALPPDWIARLWPEQHQELTKLARLLAPSSGKKPGTTEPTTPVDASQPDLAESLAIHSRPEMWTQSFLIGHAFARVDGATSNYLQRTFPGSSEAHRTTGSVTIENVNISYKGELAHLPSSAHRITLVDGGERGTIVTWDVLSCGDLLKARMPHDGRVHQVGLVNMTLAKRHENELLVSLGQPPARPKLAANNISELVTRHTERQVHYDKVEVTILWPQEENRVLKTVYITDGVIEYAGIVSLWEDDRGFTDRDFLAVPKTGKVIRMIHPMTADVPPLEATIDYFARWLHKRVFNATVQMFDHVSLNICQVNRTIDPDEGENIKVKCNIVGHHNSRCDIDALFFGLIPLSPTSLKVFAICFHAGLQDLFSTIIAEIHSTWPVRTDSSDTSNDNVGIDQAENLLRTEASNTSNTAARRRLALLEMHRNGASPSLVQTASREALAGMLVDKGIHATSDNVKDDLEWLRDNFNIQSQRRNQSKKRK